MKRLWKTQPIDTVRVSPDELRREAAKFQRKIRLRNRIEYAAGVVVIAAFGSYLWLRSLRAQHL